MMQLRHDNKRFSGNDNYEMILQRLLPTEAKVLMLVKRVSMKFVDLAIRDVAVVQTRKMLKSTC